tara:strand:+ start:227 stop:439 length:213 start_codon:yes stop_codon:yes gene_type:complete
MKAFIVGLALGLAFVYLQEPEYKTIYVYPTPENADKIEYIDKAGTCFKFNANLVNCPEESTDIKNIPLQN